MQKYVRFVKKNWKYVKNKKYYEIIVIIQGNIEVLCIAYVIQHIVYPKKRSKSFS